LRTLCNVWVKRCVVNAIGAFIAISILLPFGVEKAEAIPAFAKKYTAPCSLCHSTWPMLNSIGWKFKLNGYQMPDTRDGDEVGKTSPSFDLHLDANKALSPLSLRLDGGVDALQPKTGPASATNPGGNLANNFPCCTEGNRGRIYAAGTVDQDMAYFISYKLGDTKLESGFVRFVNLFGPGYLGVDLGAIQTADSEAVSPNREWFATPNPAYYGTSNIGARDQGGSIGYSDTGARFFGNPNGGPFSYDIMLATGTGATTAPSNSKGTAVGVLGRVDSGGFAGSLRFWTNNTAKRYFSKQAQGPYFFFSTDSCAGTTACFEPPSSAIDPDELTSDYVLSLSYNADSWQTDWVFLYNDYNVKSRADSLGNTYQMENVRRAGFSAAYIYRISSRISLGARLGMSSVPSYNQTYNGAPTAVPSATASQAEFKLEVSPVQNAKLSLAWILDNSNQQARTDSYGNKYDLQNKFVLLWDWAI